MSKLELYDILTLEDNVEYTILRIIELNNRTYYLLAEIDEEDIPEFDKMRIMEHSSSNKLREISDAKLLNELKQLFASALETDI